MTEERLVLAELLEKAGDGDFLRAVAEAVLPLLMETDVEGLIGAGRYERSGERTTWRNGYLGSARCRSPWYITTQLRKASQRLSPSTRSTPKRQTKGSAAAAGRWI